MTVTECIERTDALKPNPMTEEEKAGFLLRLEGRLAEEFYTRYWEDPPGDMPKKWPVDKDKKLSASGPYEELYIQYLSAQIDVANQEYDQYAVDMALFQQTMGDYRKHYHRSHTVRQYGWVRNLY